VSTLLRRISEGDMKKKICRSEPLDVIQFTLIEHTDIV
jgi:hypothetical protein